MNNVATEFEAKFLNVDFVQLRKVLIENGAHCKTPERLMRRMVFGGEANPSMICTYGRIRDEGDKITMSAKFVAVGDDIASQKEAMVIVDDFDEARLVLESFGLVATNVQENRRETWIMPDKTLVELDTWPGLSHYIEIEGKDEAAIQSVAQQLGLDWEARTIVSTEKLYAVEFNLDEEQVSVKMRHLVF